MVRRSSRGSLSSRCVGRRQEMRARLSPSLARRLHTELLANLGAVPTLDPGDHAQKQEPLC